MPCPRLRSLLGFLLLLLPVCAHARPYDPHPPLDPHRIDATQLGGPLDLTSTWLLTQGDDPRYAAPSYDDSHWLVIHDDTPLQSYGLHDVDAVWYRTHVHLRPGLQDLSLLLRGFSGSRQVFVNGVAISSVGAFTTGGSNVTYRGLIYSIPQASLATSDLTIAIRARIGRVSERGFVPGGLGESSTILLGSPHDLEENLSLFRFRDMTSNYTNLILQLIVLLIALSLAFAMPRQREYFALAVYLAAVFGMGLTTLFANEAYTYSATGLLLLHRTLVAASIIAMIEFIRLLFGFGRSRLLLGYEALVVFQVIAVGGYAQYRFSFGEHGLSTAAILAVNIVGEIITFPVDWGLPFLALWIWFRRRNPDALLLFVPLLIDALLSYYQAIHFLLFYLHASSSASIPEPPIAFLFVGWNEITSFFYSIALLVFLVLRTTRLARMQAATEAEIQAAQTVQQLLLARASQLTPGFDVHSVYHPASEVGGDFFLVSPDNSSDSITAILGDVSGKGLTAAMRVSMILGVLRRENSRDPADILASLNQALLSQGDMGFTTACCVRLERSGGFTVANAGHIAPYIAGLELTTPPSLPLGLAPDQSYETVHGQLAAGQTLVLMSDGVPEARSAKGELYGFDRLATLTQMPAQAIADVAQRFGQEDDITVLTLACHAS